MLFGRKFRSLKIRLQLKICVIISVPVLVTFLVVKIGTLIQLNGECAIGNTTTGGIFSVHKS